MTASEPPGNTLGLLALVFSLFHAVVKMHTVDPPTTLYSGISTHDEGSYTPIQGYMKGHGQ